MRKTIQSEEKQLHYTSSVSVNEVPRDKNTSDQLLLIAIWFMSTISEDDVDCLIPSFLHTVVMSVLHFGFASVACRITLSVTNIYTY